MNALRAIAESTGAERRAWLERQENALGRLLRYYGRPARVPRPPEAR